LFDQSLCSVDTPSEAWPNIGGQVSHQALAPLADGGDLPPTDLPTTTDCNIPTVEDFLSSTSTLPHSQAHHPSPLDPLALSDQTLHSIDTTSEAWPNTWGQAPQPAIASLAKDGNWLHTALPQTEAHLHLPQYSLHQPQQPLHSTDWERVHHKRHELSTQPTAIRLIFGPRFL